MEVEGFEQIRLFKDTVKSLARALPGGYDGSRRSAGRYINEETTLSMFIELKHEEPPMTLGKFWELLCDVPGVFAVHLEQKTWGRHHKQCTLLVYSRAHPRHGIEFELTTHNHVNNCWTISALYKSQGNRSLAMEAWRILKHSVAGRELNAGVVEIIDTELRKLAGESDFTATRQTSSSSSSAQAPTSSPMENGAARLDLRQLFGHGRGPSCDVCLKQPSVCHSVAYGLMCYRCVQDDDNMCCRCGRCAPSWSHRGWVCHKGRNFWK